MALYSGSLSPLQTGEQCLLHVEASHHPHAWKGHMAACPSALGYSKISAAQKTLAFLCGILGTVNGCQTQSLYPLEEGACGEAWPLVSLAGPVGELSTVPSVKRDFTPEGGPPSSLCGKSHVCQLCLQNTAKCTGEEAGGKDGLATMTLDTICSKQEVDSSAHFCRSLSLFLGCIGI